MGSGSPDSIGKAQNHGEADGPGPGQSCPGPSAGKDSATWSDNEESDQDEPVAKQCVHGCYDRTQSETKHPDASHGPVPGRNPFVQLRQIRGEQVLHERREVCPLTRPSAGGIAVPGF